MAGTIGATVRRITHALTTRNDLHQQGEVHCIPDTLKDECQVDIYKGDDRDEKIENEVVATIVNTEYAKAIRFSTP